MDHHKPDWSELCPEILFEIADRLGTRPNVHNFREVCKNWRFPVSQIPRNLPHLSPLFPHRLCAVDQDFFSTLSRGTLYHLIADAVFLIRPRNLPESSKPWLVAVEEFSRGKLRIRLPLSRVRATRHLPPEITLPTMLNLSDFHVSVVATGFNLRAPVPIQDRARDPGRSLEWNGGLSCKNKLVLFANPDCFKPLSIKDYTGLVWFEHGSVAWVRLSRSLDWGFLSLQGTSKFDDIVNFNKRVYAVDRTGRVYVVHYDLKWAKGETFQTLKMERIVNDSICSGCRSNWRKRLVVDSSGVLYLVQRVVYCRDKIHFKIYKLDEEKCRLDEVVSLGDDRILFVSVDCCFFASAADFPGYRGNCIVFESDSFPLYGEILPIIEQDSKKLEYAVFHFEDGNARPISAFPGYSEILWPPPKWLYGSI